MAYTLIDEKKVCRIYQDTEKALDKTLAHIVQLLDGEHQTIATAESCTGGMLSQMITSVPGASHVFELGLCTYAERMKTRLLGVPAELIAAHGVVSAEVAAAMVQGLRRQSDADLCLSVTGLAGPGGGTPEQPVGTVYAGILYGEQEAVMHLQLWRYGLTEPEPMEQTVRVRMELPEQTEPEQMQTVRQLRVEQMQTADRMQTRMVQ